MDVPHPSAPASWPLVVAPLGLPGAGKSTVARFLQGRLGLRRVDRDAIRAAMFPGESCHRLETGAAGDAAWRALDANCRLGRASVLDGMTLSREADRRRLSAIAARHRFSVLSLYVDCPPAVARARVRADRYAGAHPAADRDAALVDEVAGRFDPLPADAVRVDATLPVPALCAAALEAVTAFVGLSPRAGVS